MIARRYRRALYWILGIGALYIALWELTQLAGMPTVDRRVRAGMPVDSSYTYTDVAAKGRPRIPGRFYYCRATAYAPFLVRADYGWHAGGLAGEGGSELYLWAFGPTMRVYELEHWFN